MFAGKQGFITLRDLFRWAERYRLAEQTEKEYDWLQHLANDGKLLSEKSVNQVSEGRGKGLKRRAGGEGDEHI